MRLESMSGLTIEMPRVSAGVEERSPATGKLNRAARKEDVSLPFRFDRVVRLGRGQARPVFAVVHSNGAFFPLGQRIGATHRFVALQAADRRSGGMLPSTIEEIAAGYVHQLLAEEPHGPYVLFGWCRAGSIAYEAAQQLRAAGHEVAAVVLVATWNPAFSAEMGPVRHAFTERMYGLQVIVQDVLKVCRGELSLRTCVRQRNVVCRLLGPMPTGPGVSGPAAEAFRADQAFDVELGEQLRVASLSYRPKPFDGRVLHIRSSAEPTGYGLDRKFGWGGLARVEYVSLPGDHYTIFLEPAVSRLCDRVIDLLGARGSESGAKQEARV